MKTLLMTLIATMSTTLVPQTPPVAPQKEHVQVWHGQEVHDPWFWLREKGAPAVESYLREENAYTEDTTKHLAPFSEALYKEFLGRIKQTDLSVPTRSGKFFYYNRTAEGLQYPVWCRKAAATDLSFDEKAAEEILLDLNEVAKGKKFLLLGVFAMSDDDRRILFTLDETGLPLFSLFMKDLATGKVVGPLAERVRTVTWASDGQTVLYVTEDPVTKRATTLWRLQVGGMPAGAPVGRPEKVLEEKDALYGVDVHRTRDKKFLLLDFRSTNTWESRILEANQPEGTFRVVLPREKGHKYDVDHREGLLYIRTNKDAKNFRMVTAPVADPMNWKPFIEHRPNVLLEGIDLFKNFGVVSEKSAGFEHFRVFDFSSGKWRDVPFPEPAYLAYNVETPDFDSRLFRYSYQSMVTPPSVYDFDMAKGQSTLLKRQEVGGYNPALYASQRLWATSRDGVKVPISIVYRKDFVRNGKAPLWLYAYGSYGLGMSPFFKSENLSLLDRGFTFAIAHIRGGGEMGEAWHDDGMLMKKKNTFFDFIDCAEYLIKEKWTSKDRLVIEGRSAGGLLMGAVTNFRPDLFQAVHAAVPFVDVMNTMMDANLPLTVREYLEWGNPNEKAAFEYMRSYSPYDNLAKKSYPAILVTSSYNDNRVMYWEPAKYVAKLRTLKTDANPLLLKIKMEPAGHGGASGRYDALKDRAFEMAWMMSQVGVTK